MTVLGAGWGGECRGAYFGVLGWRYVAFRILSKAQNAAADGPKLLIDLYEAGGAGTMIGHGVMARRRRSSRKGLPPHLPTRHLPFLVVGAASYSPHLTHSNIWLTVRRKLLPNSYEVFCSGGRAKEYCTGCQVQRFGLGVWNRRVGKRPPIWRYSRHSQKRSTSRRKSLWGGLYIMEQALKAIT